MNPHNAPPPDLRIVDIGAVLPHETSDIQRSSPLIARLQEADHFTNPPLVAPAADGRFVLMDGSNRHASLRALDFPHILVQIVDYASGMVELGVWQHVVAEWAAASLRHGLEKLPGAEITAAADTSAIASFSLRDGASFGIRAPGDSLRERNAALRTVVDTYHCRATLYRTALTEPTRAWALFPKALALVTFPIYQPQDIIAAALQRAYLPPGISRHIIHGRALNLRYPMQQLRADLPLQAKNRQLADWLHAQFARRSVRYYAEATYQFDE
ncbi:MAG: hypothetical protein OXE95_01725 [Chloroflexi bacterium]|nr:hypothetical protein [Chloroflexota bacterium]MCY4246280.1 hypothetical protein [Chloroflexota bacterium]